MTKENKSVSGFLPVERKWIDRVIESGFVDLFRHFHKGPGQYTKQNVSLSLSVIFGFSFFAGKMHYLITKREQLIMELRKSKCLLKWLMGSCRM